MDTMNTDTPETDSDESLRAIKWARDHAEELEKFHRREGEYYAEIPRSADFYANAESYARMKRALTAILGQNMEGDHKKELTELRAQLGEEQQLHVQTLNERDEARQWESQALVARIQRDRVSKTLGEVREILCDALPNENQLTSFMAVTLAKERDEAWVLADRMAALLQRTRDYCGGQIVDPECGCFDCEYLRPIDDAITAWKEARSES